MQHKVNFKTEITEFEFIFPSRKVTIPSLDSPVYPTLYLLLEGELWAACISKGYQSYV